MSPIIKIFFLILCMIREFVSNDGHVLCALLSLLLLLIVKTLHTRRLIDFLGFLGNSNYLRIYLKDHSFFDSFDTLLIINFCLNGTAFCYISYVAFLGHEAINGSILFISFGLIAMGLILKIGVELLIGFVFDLYKPLNVLIFQQISSANFIGVFLLPINTLLVFYLKYDKSAVIIVTLLVLFIFILGMFKTIQSNLKLILDNFLYFILYICTLEFGPLIIIYEFYIRPNYL